MNPDRAIALILGLSVAVVLLLGVWLLRRGNSASEPPPATPTATPSPVPPAPSTATPGVAAATAAIGYRLAGIVVGDLSYAIIEDPHGVNQLYRPGQTIPGIGEVKSIEEDRITLAGSDGTVVLQLAPAATTTPTLKVAESEESWTPSVVTPESRRRRDQSESGSSP